MVKALKDLMRGNLLIFTIGDMIRMLSMFITFPYFSLYIQVLGGSNVDIGIVNSLRPLLALFIYPIAGYISDNYSRVKIIAITGYITAGLWLFFLLAPDWRWLALGTLLQGLMTFYFPASNSLMADSLPPDSRGLGYSLWRALPAAIGILSPYIGGYLITIWDIENAMRFLYALTLIAAFFIASMNLKYLREPLREDKAGLRKDFLSIITSSYKETFNVLRWLPNSLRAFALMLALGILFNGMTTSYWVVYGIHVMGLNELQWGALLLMAALLNVLLLVPAGMVIDRVGARKILIMSPFLVALPTILFPYSVSYTSTLILFAVMTVANTFIMSAAPAYMAQAIPPHMRGRVMASLGIGFLFVDIRGGSTGGGPGMGAILTIPSIIGSLLGGFIFNHDAKLLWLLLGGAMIINALLAFFYLERQ